MAADNVSLVREAYAAYARGDVARALEFVDPDLEWTYLDPGQEDPAPQTCHGRGQLGRRIRRRAGQGLRSELEEVTACRDKVMVVIHTPGIDESQARQSGDRSFLVLTLREGRIIRLRACRDRSEARDLAGLG